MSIELSLSNLSCGWQSAEVVEDTSPTDHDFSGHFGLLPIMGKTGFGKTTLLNVLSGYMPPLQGHLTWTVDGQEFSWGHNKPLKTAMKRVLPFGVARQGSDLPRVFKIGETIEGLLHFRGFERGAARIKMKKSIEAFSIDGEQADDLAEKYPHEVSGGQRQRMALACAIAHNPRVLFADEPTGSLDAETRTEVLNAIYSWLNSSNAEKDRAFVFATHSPVDISSLVRPKYLSDKPPKLDYCVVERRRSVSLGFEVKDDGPRVFGIYAFEELESKPPLSLREELV